MDVQSYFFHCNFIKNEFCCVSFLFTQSYGLFHLVSWGYFDTRGMELKSKISHYCPPMVLPMSIHLNDRQRHCSHVLTKKQLKRVVNISYQITFYHSAQNKHLFLNCVLYLQFVCELLDVRKTCFVCLWGFGMILSPLVPHWNGKNKWLRG